MISKREIAKMRKKVLSQQPKFHLEPQPLVNVHATITFSMSISLSVLARGLGFSHSLTPPSLMNTYYLLPGSECHMRVEAQL